jgi:hypothetical protein
MVYFVLRTSRAAPTELLQEQLADLGMVVLLAPADRRR